jgi:hypothetical protein
MKRGRDQLAIDSAIDRRMHPTERPVAGRASQVRALIQLRRRIALSLKRTQDEVDQTKLAEVDHDLSKHNIDIPAIEKRVAMRKNRP